MERRILLAALAGAPLGLDTPASAATAAGSAVPGVADLSSLRARGRADDAVIVLGHSRPGDGGGGLFVRIVDDTRSPDNGVTLIVDASGARWRRLHGGAIDVRWAGAKCDGLADDAQAVTRAAGLGPVLFAVGECSIGADIVVASLAEVAAGATIRVARGKTVHFNAGFTAPVGPVFSGPGAVAFDPRFVTVGHPEWWGALTNQAGFDCAPAINACIAACPETRLQWADYHIGSRVTIDQSGRVLAGVAGNQTDRPFGSRLVIDNGHSDGLQVGPDSQPKGGILSFPQHIRVSSLTIFRAARVTPPPSGFVGPCGVRLQFVATCYLDDINTMEHSNGFYLRGVVHCYLRYCQALRKYPGTTSVNDFFNGFFQDNSISIGTNSGNASLYYQNCSCFGDPALGLAQSSGIYTYGGFTDTFITRFESGVLAFGLNLNGGGSSDKSYSAEDLLIEGCVLDSCRACGIIINAGNRGAAVTIHNCYIAGAGAGNGVTVQETHGAVSITGCQVISGVGSTTVGLLISRSSGVSAQGNIFTDCFSPVVLRQATNCQIRDTVNNTTLGATPGAVWIQSSGRNIIECTVKGQVAINPAGVVISTLPAADNADGCSGIDPGCLRGGSANKLLNEGHQITAAGRFGTGNLAFGIMD